MTDQPTDQPDPTDPTEQPDRPITEQDVKDELERQHEREERRLPLTDEEERAARVFGVEPRDPDDYGSLA